MVKEYPKYNLVTEKTLNSFLTFIEKNYQDIVEKSLKEENITINEEDLRLFKTLLYLNFLNKDFYTVKEHIVQYPPKHYIKNWELDLSYELLTSLDGIEIIKNKENIKVIDLEDNYILSPSIDFKDIIAPFKDFTFLKKLNLSKNLLTNITSDFLLNLKNLKTLLLHKNPIKTIHKNAFKELKNLRYLNISRCNLKSLPEDIFFNLENLKILDLSSNKIKELAPTIFLPLKNIEKIKIGKNPFITTDLNPKKFKEIYNLAPQVQIEL